MYNYIPIGSYKPFQNKAGTTVTPITQADYDILSDEEKNADILYVILD